MIIFRVKSLVLSGALFFLPWVMQAQPLVLDQAGVESYHLGRHLEILEDPQGALTLEEAQKEANNQRFFTSEKEIPNFGFTKSVYWARFTIANPSDGKEEWLLELGYPLIDQVDVWFPKAQGGYQHLQTGDAQPFSARELIYHNFLFHLPLKKGEEKTVYLRFKTESSMQMPLTLWSHKGFTEMINHELYGIGIYYGIMLSMIFYNLFIYLSVRDASYLNYVLYILAYVMLQMSLNGLAYEYLWPNSIWWANVAVPITMAFALIFALRFAQSYLMVAVSMPKTNQAMWGMIGLLGVSLGVSVFAHYALAIKFSTGLALLSVVIIALTGIRSWKKGYRPAVYYLLAWSSILAGAMVFALKSFGVLPASFITNNGMQVGSALEVILLSLGLADRINVMRKEKYLAEKEAREASQKALENLRIADAQKEENLRIISENNRTLEKKVAKRTAAIRDLMDNTGQGFLSFGADYLIHKEYSKACEQLLGEELTGKNAMESLFAASKSHAPEQVRELMEMLFSGTDIALVEVLLPKRLTLGERVVAVEFKVIGDQKPKVMVILTDITKEVALAEQVQADEERQAIIVKVAVDKNGFLQFLREIEELFGSIHSNLIRPLDEFDLNQLLRDFHTVKGGCASYAMTQVAHYAHEVEDRLIPLSREGAVLSAEFLQEIREETQKLEALLHEVLSMLGDILPPEERNRQERVFRVPNSKIIQLEEFMLEKIGKAHLRLIKNEIEHLCAQPIAPLLRKYASAVEDLGSRLNKRVKVELKGMETEIPSVRLDSFFGAFIHLVRNSVDHGLEETDLRQMLGKPPEGRICIEAKKSEGQLHLFVRDDGAGIDTDKVIEIAKKKGVLNDQEAAEISKNQALALIFEPGFSTKDEVTDVSGRGVGMDAVKTEVEKLKGKILIRTKQNEGTTFEIVIPLAS